jgi:copper chaperone CopZ
MLFGSKKETLAVQGMSCSHCEKSVVDGVGEIDRVSRSRASGYESKVKTKRGWRLVVGETNHRSQATS